MTEVPEEVRDILIQAVCSKKTEPVKIFESCNLYHFYFPKTSFSYTKNSILRILASDANYKKARL